MNIYKSKLPERSALNIKKNAFSYMESFESLYIDQNTSITSTEIGKAFFASCPKWAERLFLIRDKMATLFGIKISGRVAEMKKRLEIFNFKSGEQLGLFKVYAKSKNEVVIGEDNKLLNIRISLFSDKQFNETPFRKLTITTTVEFNNWFGRLYFLPVGLFHKFIVPSMLKGIIVELQNKKKKRRKK